MQVFTQNPGLHILVFFVWTSDNPLQPVKMGPSFGVAAVSGIQSGISMENLRGVNFNGFFFSPFPFSLVFVVK